MFMNFHNPVTTLSSVSETSKKRKYDQTKSSDIIKVSNFVTLEFPDDNWDDINFQDLWNENNAGKVADDILSDASVSSDSEDSKGNGKTTKKSIPFNANLKATISTINKVNNIKFASIEKSHYTLYYNIKVQFERLPVAFTSAVNEGNLSGILQIIEDNFDPTCVIMYDLPCGLSIRSNKLYVVKAFAMTMYRAFPDAIQTISNITFDFDEDFTVISWISNRAATIVYPNILIEFLLFPNMNSVNNGHLMTDFTNRIAPGNNKFAKFTTSDKIRCVIDNKSKRIIEYQSTSQKVNRWCEAMKVDSL